VTRRALAVLWIACAGCGREWSLLDDQAQAWGDQAAVEAGPPLRAALGLSGLAATLCRFTDEEWRKMPEGEPVLPDPLAQWFGADPVPDLKWSEDQGLVTVIYRDAHVLGRDGALLATVMIPLSTVDVQATDGGAAGPAMAVMRATTGGCLGDERAVNGDVTFTVPGSHSWKVTVPAGVAADHLEFMGGEALPFAGDVSWSGRLDPGRIAVTTGDASTLDGLSWPATAVSSDFSVSVTVDLSEGDDTAR